MERYAATKCIRKENSRMLDYVRQRGGTSTIDGQPLPSVLSRGIRLGATIHNFVEERRLRNLSEHAIVMYRNALGKLESFLGSEKTIDSITLDDLRGFMSREMKKGLASKTLKTTRQCIRTFFQFLVDEEFLTKDPSRRLAEIRVEKKVGDPLKVEQVQALIDHFDAATEQGFRNRLLVLLLSDTGGRVSEIASIKIENIDLDDMRIKIMGKGGKERYLNIHHNTKLELGKYLRKWVVNRTNPTPYLFPNPFGNPLSRAYIGKVLRAAGNELGIDKVHPHRLRRTFATFYLSQGGDPFTLQKELGHTDLQMVRQYTSVLQQDVQVKHQQFALGAMLSTRKKHRQKGS